MQKRLKYEKIGDSAISVDLHNGYTIVALATYDYEKCTYSTTLYLKDNTINILDTIDELEPFEFCANYKTVNSVMLKYIASLLSEGLIDKYIERYEYIIRCFDKGNDFFETEQQSRSEL